MKRTKVIAFADDLIIITRGKTVTEAQNIANIELSQDNKIRFNEQKSKAMLLTRRKRRERKELEIYLNYKPLTQMYRLKNLGIILDSKLTFRDHIIAMTDKCSKLVFTLSKSAKLNWGQLCSPENYIHRGYTTHPVWSSSLDACNQQC